MQTIVRGKGKETFKEWIDKEYTIQEMIDKGYLYEKSLEFTDFLDTRIKSKINEEQVRFIRQLIRDGVDVEEVSRIQYGNIHKVKGMTFDNVIVDLTATRREDYFTQLRLKYVGYSRGRIDCWTIASQKQYTLGVRQWQTKIYLKEQHTIH